MRGLYWLKRIDCEWVRTAVRLGLMLTRIDALPLSGCTWPVLRGSIFLLHCSFLVLLRLHCCICCLLLFHPQPPPPPSPPPPPPPPPTPLLRPGHGRGRHPRRPQRWQDRGPRVVGLVGLIGVVGVAVWSCVWCGCGRRPQSIN